MKTALKRLLCRIVGHKWSYLQAFYDGTRSIPRLGHVCLRCGATRIFPPLVPPRGPNQEDALRRTMEKYLPRAKKEEDPCGPR